MLQRYLPFTILNQNYLIMLALLNSAIVMNFYRMVEKKPIVLLVLLSVYIFSIISIKNVWPTLVNSALLLVHASKQFPRNGNHTTIEIGICCLVLLIIVYKIKNKNFSLNPTLLSYLFRVSVVLIYFFSGFHKLNYDFFTSSVSCVNAINEYILGTVSNSSYIVSSTLSRFFQIATIIIEMVVPFGILFLKTKKIAAIILLFFHAYIGLSVFADFSSLALFLLVGSLLDFNSDIYTHKLVKPLKIYMFFVVGFILSWFFFKQFDFESNSISFYQGIIFVIGFLTFGLYCIRSIRNLKTSFQLSYLIYLIPLFCIIFIHTMRTYIGLGNAGNFTMFSNLVTEKSRNNHLLIDTNKTKLFDFEEDTIEIISFGNDFYFDEVQGKLLPLSEFQYRIAFIAKHKKGKIPAELIYQKNNYKIDDLRNSSFNNAKWWYRWIQFRPIQKEGCNECRW